MNASLAAKKPFLAVIWYHSVHIPYISPDAFRKFMMENNHENHSEITTRYRGPIKVIYVSILTVVVKARNLALLAIPWPILTDCV